MFGKSKKALYIHFIAGNYEQLFYTDEAYKNLKDFLKETSFTGNTDLTDGDRELCINWKNVIYIEWK